MALDKELWLQTIQESLTKSDEFLMIGQDHSAYVTNTQVHVPQAGANPTIVKNATTFPFAVTDRTDVDLTYNMNKFFAPPIRIGKDETQFISYDKRASVLGAYLRKMKNVLGNNTLYAWAPTLVGSQVVTTGTATAKALAPSATGTRKAPLLEDFFACRSILGMQNLNPADTIYGIVPENMYWELLNDTKITKHLEWGDNPVAPTGKVPMIAGIKLIRRSTVVVYDNAFSVGVTPAGLKTVNDEGTPSSPAATDNQAILVISESYVSKAMGAVEVFANDKVAEHFGDILSTYVVHGAAKLRTNQEGVVALIQTA
jgi:hypothetical protein